MPHDSKTAKAQRAKKGNNAPAAAAAPKPSKRAQQSTSSAEPRKRGNKGNFHGESLAYLESWFPAYQAAPGKKRPFWEDFCAGWAKTFPPMNRAAGNERSAESAAAKAPSAARQSVVEASSSNAEENLGAALAEAPAAEAVEPTVAPALQTVTTSEPLDPDILFARTVGIETLKRWFSTRMTKERATQKNPFDKFMLRLNTHQGPPRKSPAYKFLMRHPKYKQAIYDEYKRRFGLSKADDVGEKASGGTPSSDPSTSASTSTSTSTSGVSDPSSSTAGSGESPNISGSSGEENSPGTDAQKEKSAQDADAVADPNMDADSGESGGEDDEEDPRYVLSRRVQVAKEMFARLSEEEKAALDDDLEMDFQKKKEVYEKAARGEDLYDPGLLTQRRNNFAVIAQPFVDGLAAMCQGVVSISLICLDEPGEGDTEPELFMRNVMSLNTKRKFHQWNPDSFRDEHVRGLVNFSFDMYKLDQGQNLSGPSSRTSASALQGILNDPSLISFGNSNEVDTGGSKDGGRQKGKEQKGKGKKRELDADREKEDAKGRKGKKRKGRKVEEESEESGEETPEPECPPSPHSHSTQPRRSTRSSKHSSKDTVMKIGPPPEVSRVLRLNAKETAIPSPQSDSANNTAVSNHSNGAKTSSVDPIIPAVNSTPASSKDASVVSPPPSSSRDHPASSPVRVPPAFPQKPSLGGGGCLLPSVRIARASPQKLLMPPPGVLFEAMRCVDGTRTMEGGPNRNPASSKPRPRPKIKPVPARAFVPESLQPEGLTDARSTVSSSSAEKPTRPPISSGGKPKGRPTATGEGWYLEMKEYLLEGMEGIPNWNSLLQAWFQLESAKGFQEVGQGKRLPAKDRPKAVGTWIGLGRTKSTPATDPEILQTELIHWWKVLNPSWRQVSPTGEFLQAGEGHWGALDVSGRNGLLSVIACMNWWSNLEEGLDKDPQWVSLLKDVQWVLECLVKEVGEPPRKKSRSD